MREIISVHDVWEPLEQTLLVSRDVIISSQICVSKFQTFRLGDGCWLPIQARLEFAIETENFKRPFWVLFRPTFLSVKKNLLFVLRDLVKTD